MIPDATEVEISAAMTRLYGQFFRQDDPKPAFKMLLEDFLEDLEAVTAEGLQNACKAYRRDPANKRFPSSGGLLAHCGEEIAERRALRLDLRILERELAATP